MKREELTVPLSELKPNPDNPRTIKKQKLNQLEKSLAEFPEMMQLRPIVVDENNVILGGNMRYEALKASGAVNTQVVKVTGLTDAQKREFVIKDNVPFGDWDWDKLANEWDADELNDWGVALPKWDDGADLTGASNAEYKAFIEKFKPKLTTDDCYTPPAVFDAVEKWVRKTYKIPDTVKTLRPFKPGGDYQREDYSGDVVVIDNPPFSILTEILRWYLDRNVRFFLFAQAVTNFNALQGDKRLTRVIAFADITYENGAHVSTGFITNMEPGVAIRTSAELHDAVEAASDKKTADLGKYRRPRNVKVASDFAKANRAGCENVFTFDQVCLVKNIDAMRAKGKALYGAGCIVSDAVADKLDRDAAEAERRRAARMGEQPGGLCLELSAREKAIVAELNKSDGGFNE